MIKKTIVGVLATLLLMGALVVPVSAMNQTQDQVLLTEEIPYQVIVLACQAVEREKIADADLALCWYRDGLMTVTKVDSGAYVVFTPAGGSITILETGAL